MMLAPRLWIAAAALGLGAVAFSAPVEARGFGGFRGGIGGFHGGGRGFGHVRNPVVSMRAGSFRSPFLNRGGMVSRQFLFRRPFAVDRHFFFRNHRFVGSFAGYPYADYPYADYSYGYPYSANDSAYAIPPDDQGMTQTPSSYEDPYNEGGAYGAGCALLIRLEHSGGHLHVRRIPLCN